MLLTLLLMLLRRPQYSFDLRLVRTMLAYIRTQWLGSPMEQQQQQRPESRAPGGAAAAAATSAAGAAGTCLGGSSNAVDAVEAALRVVFLGLCHMEDVAMMVRLVDQVRTGLQHMGWQRSIARKRG